MKKILTHHKLLSILSIIFLISITIPLILEFYFKINQGGWASFWGSYLGIIPSGIVSAGVILFEKRLDHIDNNKKPWDLLYDKAEEINYKQIPQLRSIATLPTGAYTTPLSPIVKGKLSVTKDSLSELTEFLYNTLDPFYHKYSPKDLKLGGFCQTLTPQLIIAKASTDALLFSNPEVITLESCGKEYAEVLKSFKEIHAYIKNNSSFS